MDPSKCIKCVGFFALPGTKYCSVCTKKANGAIQDGPIQILDVCPSGARWTHAGCLSCYGVDQIVVFPDCVVSVNQDLSVLAFSNGQRVVSAPRPFDYTHMRPVVRLGRNWIYATTPDGYVSGVDTSSRKAVRSPALYRDARTGQRQYGMVTDFRVHRTLRGVCLTGFLHGEDDSEERLRQIFLDPRTLRLIPDPALQSPDRKIPNLPHDESTPDAIDTETCNAVPDDIVLPKHTSTGVLRQWNVYHSATDDFGGTIMLALSGNRAEVFVQNGLTRIYCKVRQDPFAYLPCLQGADESRDAATERMGS